MRLRLTLTGMAMWGALSRRILRISTVALSVMLSNQAVADTEEDASLKNYSTFARMGPEAIKVGPPPQRASRFSAEECRIINRLLLYTMSYYPIKNPKQVLSRRLGVGLIYFIGLDRKRIACDGPHIQWTTPGDKDFLGAMIVSIMILEDDSKVAKDLASRFGDMVATKSVAEIAPPIAVSEAQRTAWREDGARLSDDTGLSVAVFTKLRGEGYTRQQIADAAQDLKAIRGFTANDVSCYTPYFVNTSKEFRGETKRVIESKGQLKFKENDSLVEALAQAVLARGCRSR